MAPSCRRGEKGEEDDEDETSATLFHSSICVCVSSSFMGESSPFAPFSLFILPIPFEVTIIPPFDKPAPGLLVRRLLRGEGEMREEEE